MERKDLNILMLEDDHFDAELNIAQLKFLEEYQCHVNWVKDKSEFIHQLNTYDPDIILSDFKLADCTGLDALNELKATNRLIPFIFVTGAIDEETAVSTIKAGAWDYVVKDRLFRLPLAIRSALQLKNEQIQKSLAEKAFKYSETRWKFALEGAGDGLWDWKLTANELYYSQQWKTMLGYQEHELNGTFEVWQNLIHPEDIEGFSIHLANFFHNQLPLFQYEYRLRAKDGEYKWILTRGKILEWSDNEKPSRFIGTNTDITERKKTEVTLLDNHVKLELQNEELKKAKDKAEESDKLKSAFLANVSHEIRTPMNAILGFSSLLEIDGQTEQKRKNYISLINKRGNDLLFIINNILDISRLETNQLTIHSNFCDLNKLLDDINHDFISVDNYEIKKPIEIKIKKGLSDYNSIVITDSERLKQILINLLSNALKFTETGFVEYGYFVENQEKIIFFVKDSGIGIPENKKKIIFEPFRQVEEENYLSRNYGGTGLGLSIVKGLLSLMNGEIWFESKVNEGSAFYFSIPYFTINQ